MLCLTAVTITSCKNEITNDPVTEVAENQHGDAHKGNHPHHDGGRKGRPPHGERKGPPKGGSPEQTRTLEEIGGYKIGDVATDFNLKNVDGSMVSLAGIENAKGYIVTFTCNECPFAKMYEDRLIEVHNTYASQGYGVVAINPNNPEDEREGYTAMQTRAKDKGFPFPYLVDEGQQLYPKYGAVRTPHVFLLDKDLKVQYIGAIDDNAKSPEDVNVKYLENAIKALEEGKSPEPNYTKAIGCPIKAKRA